MTTDLKTVTAVARTERRAPGRASVLRRRSPTSVPLASVVVVALVAAASMLPFAFLVITSMQPTADGGIGGVWKELGERLPIGQYMANSGIVSLSATAGVVVLSCMAGFGFAKLPYPGSTVTFGLVVVAIAVPLASTILPNYLNFARLGGVGVFWGPIVMYTVASLPFGVLLMTSFFRSLPDELIESGLMDGAHYGRIFMSVMVPLAVPAMVTVAVISFLASWNDLLTGLLFLPDPEMRTISVGIAALQGVRNANVDMVLAGSLLSALPPVIAFIAFQRYLVTGITAGIGK